MRHTYLLISSLILVCMMPLLGGCDNSTDPPGDGGAPVMAPAQLDLLESTERALLASNAAYLALRDMHADSASFFTTIPIDAGLLQTYERALAHVALSTQITAADSVKGMMTFPRPTARSVIVRVTKGTPWFDAWKQGEALTGYAELDQLMVLHQLSVGQPYEEASSWRIVLSAAQPINMDALARHMETLSGIELAAPNGLAGDGSDITGSIDATGVELIYQVRWGDCPSGCMFMHAWTFHVAWNGDVSLMSIKGMDLP